ncbi:MAG: cupin domain-containing protein [Bacteroidota bacterium]
MKNRKEYINSGILEEFVLGLTSEAENIEIQKLALQHPDIKKEIDSITESLISYAQKTSPELDPTIKPMVLATIDYTERLKGGEAPSFPPELNAHSKISDFEQWLNRKDFVLPDDFEDVHAKIIGADASKTTAVTWLKYGSPEEMHHNQFEKFLILEGTCDLTIEGKIYSLVAGDYLGIPLHVKHDVKVTSLIPCKIILQRVAA